MDRSSQLSPWHLGLFTTRFPQICLLPGLQFITNFPVTRDQSYHLRRLDLSSQPGLQVERPALQQLPAAVVTAVATAAAKAEIDAATTTSNPRLSP